MSDAQALFQAMADRAELRVEDLHKLSRRLLDVACRIRAGETLHHDDDVVAFAAHALKAASIAALAAAPAPAPIAQPPLTNEQIEAMWNSKTRFTDYMPPTAFDRYHQGVRESEQAHGIGAQEPKP